MQIPKPTDADRARFKSLVPDKPGVEVKPMFGNVAAFVNGNMFMGLFGSDLGVRLAQADQQRLSAAGGGPFGPPERPMGGYLSLPAGLSEAEARPWVASALEYVSTLPPKQARPARKR